jgi:hypothetical protein
VLQEICRTSCSAVLCRTSCSASTDVPYLLQCRVVSYLLQCLNRCALRSAVPQQMYRTSCSARHFITFRTHVTDTRCLQRVFQSVDSVDHLVVLRCDRQSFSFAEQLYTTDPNIRRLLVRIVRLTVVQCCLCPFACSCNGHRQKEDRSREMRQI